MTIEVERAPREAPRRRYVGSRQKKLKGDLFVRGKARYVADIELPGMLHAAVLRSPHAHAHVKSVDVSRALEISDVVAAVSGEDARELTGPVPHFIDPAVFGGKTAEVRCLAVEKVVYAGQPVAAVVAASRNDAEAALDAIAVEYEPLEVGLEPAAGTQGGTLLYEGWEDNTIIHIPFVEGDVEAAFAEAEHTLEDEVRIQRYTTAPIETRGYVADWDTSAESLTFYGACQNPHPLRWVLSHALGLPEGKIRIVAPHVGGGFGLKMHGHPEEALVCMLSRMLERPVRWIEDRRETFLIGGREQTHTFKVAFDDEGRITGLRNNIVANVGALGAPPGWGMAFLTALSFPTGYRIPNQDVQVSIVATNKGPWNASRGYGKEATNLVMERIVDLVAQKLRMAPAEVRRRNFINKDEFPYKTNAGLNIDSGDYHGALDKALAMMGYDDLRAEQERLRAEGRYLGIGLAFELTPEGGDIPGTLVAGFDTTTVKMDPQGKVTVLTGVTTPGGGNETGIAQIVADEVGVSLEDVTVIQGDTGLCPYGFGNYSGRSMLVGGGSAALAARDIREKLAKVAAAMLETEPENLEFGEGVISRRDNPDASLPTETVAYSVLTLAFATAAMVEPTLESTRVYKPDNITHIPDEKGRIQPYPSYSSAVHLAVVEVDAETGVVDLKRFGVVHDCGTIINPTFVEGQMQGAVAMGVGAALSEELIYDDEGNLLTDRFKTYLMPRAGDLPSFEMEHQVTPSPFTLLGAKGAGEAGVGGSQAAVANAVNDALAPLGVTLRQMPLSPPNVLRAIREAAEKGGVS